MARASASSSPSAKKLVLLAVAAAAAWTAARASVASVDVATCGAKIDGCRPEDNNDDDDDDGENLVSLVDDFVDMHRGVLPLGRALSRGNVLPIMTAPRGMAHWVVSTTKDLGARWFHDPHQVTFYGFRCTHQPSPWIGDYGQFLVVPEIEGLMNPIYSLHKSTYKPHLFRGRLLNYCSHKGCAEVVFAPSASGAIMETHFPPGLVGTRRLAVLIRDGEISIRRDEVTGDYHIEGFSASYKKGIVDQETKLTSEGLRTYSRFRNFFSMTLSATDVPELAVARPEVNCVDNDSPSCVASISWAPRDAQSAQRALLRIGTSFISVDQARFNAERELGNFSGAIDLANRVAARWNKMLSRIEVEDDAPAGPNDESTRARKIQLYTCLYRALLFPRLLAETLRDGSVVHMSPYTRPAAVRPGPVATDSGFWDAYRAVYPLLHLVFPEVAREVLRGWVQAYRELGRVPQWPSPGPRAEMVSTMGDVSLAEAIVNGALEGDDAAQAFAALLRNAYEPFGADGTNANSRGEQLAQFAERGFIPGLVSESLDMALCDYAIAQAAAARGRHDIRQDLERRAGFWRHLFDPETGFFRPKQADGSFAEPFNEYAWSAAYTEGGPWQYRFAVPHDPAGLAEAYGGPEALCTALRATVRGVPTFHLPHVIHEATEMGAHCFGQYAHNNQPVHHVLYMFAHAGPECALEGQAWIQHTLETLYGSFGYAGDEDNGEMSSWYLLSSLGLYALAPGSGAYQVGAPPTFRKIVVHREQETTPGSRPLVISREAALPLSNVTGRTIRVASGVTWRGRTHAFADGAVTLPYKELLAGGDLVFIG